MNREEQVDWPEHDGCHDYWETMVEILRQNNARIAVRWMPSHLDEEGKQAQREAFIAQGGKQEWIRGNCGADEMAKKGAKLAAPPGHLLEREKILRTFTRTVQRMLVHVWAAEKGLVDSKEVDGHEADLDDRVFGFEYNELGGDLHSDSYINAFDDLLEEMHPGPMGNCLAREHDVDLWNDFECDHQEGDGSSVGLGGCGVLQDSVASATNKLSNCRSGTQGYGVCDNVRKRLEKYRNLADDVGRYYPVRQPDEGFDVDTPTNTYLQNVDTFSKMRRRACKLCKLDMRSEWVEPFVWCIGAFRWSQEYDSSDNIVEQRRNSCTFVELAMCRRCPHRGQSGPT